MALTAQQLREAAMAHAERAHALLNAADAENAAAPADGSVSARVGHRVALARAHGELALAISALVIPNIAPLQERS